MHPFTRQFFEPVDTKEIVATWRLLLSGLAELQVAFAHKEGDWVASPKLRDDAKRWLEELEDHSRHLRVARENLERWTSGDQPRPRRVIAAAHADLTMLATCLHQVCAEVILLGSLELVTFPEKEPGSSAMPAKVNPTQAEALRMICKLVISNNNLVSICDEPFNQNILFRCLEESTRLLADGIPSFSKNLVEGLELTRKESP